MEQELESSGMPRMFFRAFVEIEDGLIELGVPDDVIEKTLDRIQKVLGRALEHAGEAEDADTAADDEAPGEGQ